MRFKPVQGKAVGVLFCVLPFSPSSLSLSKAQPNQGQPHRWQILKEQTSAGPEQGQETTAQSSAGPEQGQKTKEEEDEELEGEEEEQGEEKEGEEKYKKEEKGETLF